jgi:hypothetical protein
VLLLQVKEHSEATVECLVDIDLGAVDLVHNDTHNKSMTALFSIWLSTFWSRWQSPDVILRFSWRSITAHRAKLEDAEMEIQAHLVTYHISHKDASSLSRQDLYGD